MSRQLRKSTIKPNIPEGAKPGTPPSGGSNVTPSPRLGQHVHLDGGLYAFSAFLSDGLQIYKLVETMVTDYQVELDDPNDEIFIRIKVDRGKPVEKCKLGTVCRCGLCNR